MEIIRWFAAGGIIILPLLVLSVIAIALIIERIRFWNRVLRRQNKVVRDALNLYRLDDVFSALEKLRQNRDLPVARILMAPLELQRPTLEKFRLAMKTEAQAEIPIIKRFQGIFDTITGLAPLLGLLGTILGLIASFSGLNVGDIGGTKTAVVTAGISEALIATATGLVVAIFTLLFANAFKLLYQRQLTLIQQYGGQLELLYLERCEQGETVNGL